MTNRLTLLACLAAAIAALLLVGAVSGTLLRHTVQVVPLALVLAGVLGRQSGAPWAAIGVFLLWFAIMAAIGCFLAGLPSFVSGHFSPAEIALTVVIGAACVVGVPAAWRVRSGRPFAGAAVVAISALLQFGALWLSYRFVR